MSGMAQAFKDQREGCWRICCGQFFRKPPWWIVLPILLTLLGGMGVVGAAYWTNDGQVKQRVTRSEVRTDALSEGQEEIKGDVRALHKKIDDEVIRKLDAIRVDLTPYRTTR